MKIVLLYTGSTGFPLGDAYTNRVLSLAKGLVSIGCNIILFIIYPGRGTSVNSKAGIFDSIPYEYLTPKKTSGYSVVKKMIGIWGIFKAIQKLLFKHSNADAVISFTESSIQNIPIAFISRVKRILFIREVNEYPELVLKKGVNGLSKYENSKIKRSLRFFDGLICISGALRYYYRVNHSFQKTLLIVPIVVDKERFQFQKNTSPEKYIAYCGNLFGEKDGVEILINAFSKISDQYPEYKLLLIGDTRNTIEFNKLEKLIHDLDLTTRVDFTGYVNREEIPFILSKSSVLTLARPDNTQAKAGFPTKLGEYLATSRPVIVTAVGEIPRYIVDGVNGFLAEPGSVESFADKLKYVLQHYDSAEKIGKKGRELIESVFDPGYQAKRIQEFILDLKKNRK